MKREPSREDPMTCEPQPVEDCSPWRTIWFSPRRTIRAIIAAKVRPGWTPVVGLAIVASLLHTINSAQIPLPGWRFRLFMLGVVGCMVVVAIGPGPAILAWHGKWRGGVGTRRDIRQALAWSYAPLAVSAECWIPLWIAAGTSYDYSTPLNPVLRFVTLPLYVVADVVAPLWSLALGVAMLAEVQRYSIWRAVDGLVLLSFVAVITMILVALVLIAVMSSSGGPHAGG